MFSKACEYSIRATIFVAQQSQQNQKVGVKDIAKAIDSPEAFTGKIMQQLSKNGFVHSIKGPYGGFWLDKETMKKTKLSDLVDLFDGEEVYNGCMLGLSSCDGEQPCPLHEETQDMLTNLRTFLKAKSIYDVLYTQEDQLNQFWLKKG